MATLEAELAGLDALETVVPRAPEPWVPHLGRRRGRSSARSRSRCCSGSSSSGAAGSREFVLPGPVAVFGTLFDNFGDYVSAAIVTLQRAAIGFSVAVVIGTLIGALVVRSRVLRSAVGSMITGLMTMPSIAWFPAAIVLFGLTESAILFVIVIGAAPSVANGFIAGVDNTPPILVRAARMLGAKGWSSFRHVVLPAALPTYIGGLKQGWAFAWRSLLAGELLVQIAGKESLGRELDTARQFADYKGVYATMIVILVIGILVDSLFFGQIERRIRRRYGLIDAAAND